MIYFTLFLEFFKVGAFSFGGGAVMLPMLEQMVEHHGWMTQEQLYNFVGVSESTPGPIAVNLSTYIGTILGGPFGALCATTGVVLPSFLIILIVAKAYRQFKENQYIGNALDMLKPVIVGLLGCATISIAANIFSGFDIQCFAGGLLTAQNGISLFVIICAGIFTIKKMHPIAIILACSGIGALLGYVILG